MSRRSATSTGPTWTSSSSPPSLIIDEVVLGDELADQLERRLEAYARRFQPRLVKKHGVLPV